MVVRRLKGNESSNCFYMAFSYIIDPVDSGLYIEDDIYYVDSLFSTLLRSEDLWVRNCVYPAS